MRGLVFCVLVGFGCCTVVCFRNLDFVSGWCDGRCELCYSCGVLILQDSWGAGGFMCG